MKKKKWFTAAARVWIYVRTETTRIKAARVGPYRTPKDRRIALGNPAWQRTPKEGRNREKLVEVDFLSSVMYNSLIMIFPPFSKC